ncbi:MAG: family 20 glycosylhydrolase [Clostridia bacterium]|nr:family 20 glycosylhydrolase [Clostridia bacterium]
MLHLIPKVKTLKINDGFLSENTVFISTDFKDERLNIAAKNLPQSADGVQVEFNIQNQDSELYEITIKEDLISVNAACVVAAFYAIQTLRQIFTHSKIPCLYIKDWPDLKYRGFYHDATRGRILNLNTAKKLIDTMAYYKLNSLQLYVEHVYEFKELQELNKTTGYLTKEELSQIDLYAKQNFIDFIPSLSTFGHMYEILEQEPFKDLRVLQKNFKNYLFARMMHHTINPEKPQSIQLVKSLIDQYAPCFSSEYFNICCDETFDLKNYKGKTDSKTLYIQFVKQIIAHVKQKGKKVMMWADILLEYPELIEQIDDDIYFLNWEYEPEPNEQKIIKFKNLGRTQIVCPGTWSWYRFCERVEWEEQNISNMANYAYNHGAFGMLNTNWGDFGHPAPVQLALYGMVLGAAKSWEHSTELNNTYFAAVDHLLYKQDGAVAILKQLSLYHSKLEWRDFVAVKVAFQYGDKPEIKLSEQDVKDIQNEYKDIMSKINALPKNEFLSCMALSAKAVLVIAEITARIAGYNIERITSTSEFLSEYSKQWLAQSKEKELFLVTEVFEILEAKSKEI